MKIKIEKKDLPKPRNPVIMAMRMRKSGSHEKPYKTKRNQAKVSLKREWA